MTERVPADKIEEIVGAKRHDTRHIGRLIGPKGDGNLYILHSKGCFEEAPDLRECRFSKFLDMYGVFPEAWEGYRDVPVMITILPHYGVVPDQEEIDSSEKKNHRSS